MDVPRLFKTATPEFVAKKVFKIKSVKRNEPDDAEKIALSVHATQEEEEHMTEPSNDTSSTTETTASTTTRNEKVPVLAIGTYHRKEAAPILAAPAKMDLQIVTTPTSSKPGSSKEPTQPLPHPSECGQPCVSAQSQMFHNRTTNAQGPPPTWQPPRPPGMERSDHDYTNDYEDPEELARCRGMTPSNLLIQSPTLNFNSYEMSLSQQRKSQQHQQSAPPLMDWHEAGGVLHKNADGAYYIPSGSLRTASSKLSPASSGQRYLDQPHTSSTPAPNSTPYSDASSTLLKYPLTGTQPNRRRQVTSMNGQNLTNETSRKKKKLDDDSSCWKGSTSKCTLLLATLLIFAILTILFMLFRAPSYVYTEPSPSADISTSASRYSELGLRALPPVISLGERVDVEFFPKHMATTELILARPTRILLNATVGSGAQLALLIRAGVPPSLSLHDALFPIRSDRMRDSKSPTHIVEEAPNTLRHKRSVIGMSGGRRGVEILSPRSTTFEQFLLEGRHFLTFINERNRIEPISFVAEEVVKPTKPTTTKAGGHPLAPILLCEANCNNRGECIYGKCRCASGFTGSACEEAICPVVCSGNGVFSGGVCVCKTGFKGKECEMRSNWCEVADCNGRGRCDTDGKCRCNAGWTGDGCELKACPHATCSDHGVCVNGTCYCIDGWRGQDCSIFADAVQQPIATSQPVSAEKPKTKPKKSEKRPVVNTRELPKSNEKECNGHGKKIDKICFCDNGFEGIDCQLKNCNNCTNGDCLQDGSCHCWNGWNGVNCEFKSCAMGCEEHGKCQENGKCRCNHGWNGDNCYLDGCPNQCSGKGECAYDVQSALWTCKCQAGMTGMDCSLAVEMHCDDGLDNDNDGLIDCDDPECCDSASCSSESVCSTAMSPLEVLLRMPPVFNANFAQRVGFLIKDKSVQSYTDSSQFNESLIAVIRGRVVWRGVNSASSAEDHFTDPSVSPTVPLTGVRVSDAAHPLYGFTLTRSDGYFDLVVNGARSVNLQFLRTQFQGTKKSVYVTPGQIVHIDDIVVQRSSSQPAPSAPLARAKCSPTLRYIPEVSIISNWQYTNDGIENDSDSATLIVDSKSVFESLPIVGTDVQMVYDSARSTSAPSTMLIGLLDELIEKDLRKIHLDIRIAGRRFDYILAPRINLTHTFTWDKMNAYRQSETGLVPVTVRVGYEYAKCERDSEIVWITRRSRMLGATSRKMIGKMWTLNIHHHLDVVNNIVEMGDGGYRVIPEYEPMVSTLAGVDGAKRDIECGIDKCDGLLEQIPLFRPTSVTYAADGSLLIGDHNLIRRIGLDGSINTVLSLSLADTSHSYYLDVSPFDGTIVISLPLHKQVWKILSLTPDDPANNHEVYAGDGSVCGSAVDACGDGGLAQNAQLIFPKGVAFDRFGNLYLADSRRIRVIDTIGHIRSIGEVTPESNPIRSCNPISKLADLQMEWPTSISIESTTGHIFVLDTNLIYEIDPIHDLVTIALGVPTTCDKNITASANSPLHSHHLQNVRAISVSDDGSILVVESDGKRLNQVRRLSPDRSDFSILVGGKSPCSCDVAACGCDDSTTRREITATLAHLNSPQAVTVSPAGEIIVADSANGKIKKISKRMAKYDGKTRTYEVVDPETMEMFKFNRHGLHTSTISMITGKAIYNFTYSVDSPNAIISSIRGSSGLLLSVNKHNETSIDIESSSGETTSLTISAYDGTIEMVSRRATSSLNQRDVTKLSYTSTGLLESRVDTATAIVFEYDKNGRAVGLKREREYWTLGEETISMGRAITDVFLNGIRTMQMRIGEGDVSVQHVHGKTTRLITLHREGYSMTSPFGTSSLFDKTSSNGIDEPVISRRRTTVPAISNPQRRALTTRWDWRYVMKKGGENRKVAEVGFRPRINGVNMFSMEYDVSLNRDTLRTGSGDSALFHVDYTNSGRIMKISSPKNSDYPVFDEMNVTFDSMGRESSVQWGNWKKEFAYDSNNRMVEMTEEGARVPVKMTYLGMSRNPNSIQHDGATWQLQYDNYDRIKEATSPSGETTTFSAISIGGNEWVLKRLSPLNTRPWLLRVNRNNDILESASPDGLHHWIIKKDQIGKVIMEVNDGKVTQISNWNANGDVIETRSDEMTENVTMQGHLIARKELAIRNLATSFTYEYDDYLRLISIQPVIEQSVFEPIHISYDERTGHVSGVNGFSIIRDSTTTRSQGHGMTYETKRSTEHRQVVERKIIFGDARASLKINRDRVGRAEQSEIRISTSSGVKELKTSRTFDAAGRVASLETNGEDKLRLLYNNDGRIEKINDRIVEYHRGGAVKSFPDIQDFQVDSIGWVIRRNNASFGYDGKGRLISAKKNDINYQFSYDLKDRLIMIQKDKSTKDSEIYTLYYGIDDRISHFSKNGIISMILYDDENQPFSIISSDGARLALLCDDTNTVQTVLTDSRMLKSTQRSVFGNVVHDSNPEFFIPLGYLGGVDIDGINVTILNGRPLDLLTGRYMSIAPNSVKQLKFGFDFGNSMDLMALEAELSAFKIPEIPRDISSWFSIVGMSPTLLPSAHLGLPSQGAVVHRLLSSFPRKLDPLTHLNTVIPSKLHAVKDTNPLWSIEDIGFSNLLVMVNKGSQIKVNTLPILAQDETTVVRKLLNDAQLIQFDTWSPVPVKHLWKPSNGESLASASFPHFTLVANKDNVELRNGKSKIIVHSTKTMEEVSRKLSDDLRNRESISVWKAERKRFESNEKLWMEWSDREQRELKSKGSVSGYQVELKPTHYDSLFATIHSWKFVRA